MSSRIEFADRPLAVLALGGNALSPPDADVEDYQPERARIDATARALNAHARAGYRLLLVHGNGPQVGRLLRHDPARSNLDIHVAQTQGELGYLLAAALDEPAVGVLTRVLVGQDAGPPVKAVGPLLAEPPEGVACERIGEGWRVVVPSPEPIEVVEQDAIAALLDTRHVIAAGGGGVPLVAGGGALDAVIDKDRVAALLAVELDAERLVFATNVDHVFSGYGTGQARAELSISLDQGRRLIDRGEVSAGSMLPKLESAMRFVSATGRSAQICGLAALEKASAGAPGTTVHG